MTTTTPDPAAPAAAESTPPAGEPTPAAPAAATPTTTPTDGITPEVQALIDAERAKASKDANREAKGLRDRLAAFEKAEQDRKDAELTEAERATKAAADADARADKAEDRARQNALKASVAIASASKGLDADLALKLIDGIEFDDDGEPQGVAEAIEALVEKHPNLVVPGKAGTSPTNPPRGGATPPKSDAERLSEFRNPGAAKWWRSN